LLAVAPEIAEVRQDLLPRGGRALAGAQPELARDVLARPHELEERLGEGLEQRGDPGEDPRVVDLLAVRPAEGRAGEALEPLAGCELADVGALDAVANREGEQLRRARELGELPGELRDDLAARGGRQAL